MEGDSKVTFSIEIPEDVATKADMSDGTTVDELAYEVYVGEEVMYEGYVGLSGTRQFSLELNLVTGQTYDLLFWAQKKGPNNDHNYYYNTNSLKNVHAHYWDGRKDANDENRDAFCTLYSVTVPKDAKTFSPADPAILTRPFSQINLCATDYEYVSELDLTMKSKISVNGVADTYNFLTGEVSGTASVDFDLAQIPLEKGEKISVNGTEYAYVGMNYILAPENTKFNADGTPQQDPKSLTDLGAQFEYNNLTVDVEVPNVPYQRNFRTNIIGNFFTGDATITIQIDEAFEKEDYPVQYN
jgi:hypothetical protein